MEHPLDVGYREDRLAFEGRDLVARLEAGLFGRRARHDFGDGGLLPRIEHESHDVRHGMGILQILGDRLLGLLEGFHDSIAGRVTVDAGRAFTGIGRFRRRLPLEKGDRLRRLPGGGRSSLRPERRLVARVGRVQFQGALERFLEALRRVRGPRAPESGVGSITAIKGLVGVHEERRPRLAVVELEEIEVDAPPLDDPHADEFGHQV